MSLLLRCKKMSFQSLDLSQPNQNTTLKSACWINPWNTQTVISNNLLHVQHRTKLNNKKGQQMYPAVCANGPTCVRMFICHQIPHKTCTLAIETLYKILQILYRQKIKYEQCKTLSRLSGCCLHLGSKTLSRWAAVGLSVISHWVINTADTGGFQWPGTCNLSE